MRLGILKLFTGEVLKILCDMGHGDEVVIADANFPAATLAWRLVRLLEPDDVACLRAILHVGSVGQQLLRAGDPDGIDGWRGQPKRISAHSDPSFSRQN